MSDYCEEKPQGHGGITFGKVVAGAAMAAGAVLLGVTVYQGIGPDGSSFSLSGIAKTLVKPFLTEGSIVNGEFKDVALNSLGKAAVGASLLGGGYALSSKMDSRSEALQEQAQTQALLCGDPIPGGHAEKVQMAAVQSLMKGRVIAASPEFAGQALG